MGIAATLGTPLGLVATAAAQDASGRPVGARPNFLWLTCEDLSPILGCYGDAYARTPNLDAFAKTAVRFDLAFAPAPVCAAARTGLLFGRPAGSMGANNHRSRPITDSRIRGYAAHLREAGYWTSNGKADYNSATFKDVIKDCWDINGTWRDRPKDTAKPFLSVINFGETHASYGMVNAYAKFQKEIQSQLLPEEIHDPKKAPVPPWMPDTDVMRRTVARYYDCATAMDKLVGKALKDLADDGLAEDTIVFFYSDHGTGLPRYKQSPLDTGLRVPLLVRVPEKYRHLLDAKPGGSTDRLVSFEDFGPTLITMIGAPVPETMQGRPFMPPTASPPREIVYGARDRIDEMFEIQRTVRDKRFRYLRNFLPHVPHVQQNNYWRGAESADELWALHRAGKLPPAAAKLFGPKPVEELYDLRADPWEAKNLADDAAHADRLTRMREQLGQQIRQAVDLCMVPEPELTARANGRPLTDLAKELPLEAIIAAAERVGRSGTDALAPRLKDAEPMVRWWTVVALRQNADDAATAALQTALTDQHPLVSGEAALALVARAAAGSDEAFVKLLGGAPDGYAPYLARMAIFSGPRKRLQPLMEKALALRGGTFQPLQQGIRALEQMSD
jgi:arylsulfatase A-like enzyme